MRAILDASWRWTVWTVVSSLAVGFAVVGQTPPVVGKAPPAVETELPAPGGFDDLPAPPPAPPPAAPVKSDAGSKPPAITDTKQKSKTPAPAPMKKASDPTVRAPAESPKETGKASEPQKVEVKPSEVKPIETKPTASTMETSTPPPTPKEAMEEPAPPTLPAAFEKAPSVIETSNKLSRRRLQRDRKKPELLGDWPSEAPSLPPSKLAISEPRPLVNYSANKAAFENRPPAPMPSPLSDPRPTPAAALKSGVPEATAEKKITSKPPTNLKPSIEQAGSASEPLARSSPRNLHTVPTKQHAPDTAASSSTMTAENTPPKSDDRVRRTSHQMVSEASSTLSSIAADPPQPPTNAGAAELKSEPTAGPQFELVHPQIMKFEVVSAASVSRHEPTIERAQFVSPGNARSNEYDVQQPEVELRTSVQSYPVKIWIVDGWETWKELARLEYGAEALADALAKFNRSVRKGTDALAAGAKIRLPPRSVLEGTSGQVVGKPTLFRDAVNRPPATAVKPFEMSDPSTVGQPIATSSGTRGKRAPTTSRLPSPVPSSDAVPLLEEKTSAPSKRIMPDGEPLPSASPSSNASAPEYIVQKEGMTLYMVAAQSLGDGKQKDAIYQLNRDRLGSQDGELKVGAKLRLPPGAKLPQ